MAVDEDDEAVEERKKRKRKEQKQLMKIKQSKDFKRRKSEKSRAYDDDDSDDAIARSLLAKSKPLPGQLENCEICERRFTVTPYSKTGPDGGLLCTKCSKELADEEKKNQPKKKRGPTRGKRRQTESDRMMGDVKPGSKSLLESCVKKVADVVQDIEEFGDLPQYLLDRLSQILSKKRVINSRTIDLFLRPEVDRINVYDCGKLEQDDFQRIFAFLPDVETVNLRFAGQLKDEALSYMIDKNTKIKHLQLGATNLISDDVWRLLIETLGPQLETLKLSELNDTFDDDTVLFLASNLPNLRRLKMRQCMRLTGDATVPMIARMATLEHLTLAVGQDASSEALVALIESLGSGLKTLCLENYHDTDDDVLAAIHTNCTALRKLRLTGSAICSDAGFANLFTNWSNLPIPDIDLSDNRDIDNGNPDGPTDVPIGLGSEGFKAMMNHSGEKLERLNIHSCRHISHEALSEVFDGKRQYPLLKDMDLSFMTVVDDFMVTGIFRSCPRLSKLAVFACFKARDVQIPGGVAVIGLPNAQVEVVVTGHVGDEL